MTKEKKRVMKKDDVFGVASARLENETRVETEEMAAGFNNLIALSVLTPNTGSYHDN